MKKKHMDSMMEVIWSEVKRVRDEGQKEYAQTEDNVFANFDRVASCLKISREKALMVYVLKHIDGIASFIEGHRSQREKVQGRLTDAIVYLCILWGMIESEPKYPEKSKYYYNRQKEGK